MLSKIQEMASERLLLSAIYCQRAFVLFDFEQTKAKLDEIHGTAVSVCKCLHLVK